MLSNVWAFVKVEAQNDPVSIITLMIGDFCFLKLEYDSAGLNSLIKPQSNYMQKTSLKTGIWLVEIEF